jgi:hypothetical protein
MAKVTEHISRHALDDRKERFHARRVQPPGVDLSTMIDGFLSHFRTEAEARGQVETAKKRMKQIQAALGQVKASDEAVLTRSALIREYDMVLGHRQRAQQWLNIWSHITDSPRLQAIVVDRRDPLAGEAQELLTMKLRASSSREYARIHEQELTKRNNALREKLMKRRPDDEFGRK